MIEETLRKIEETVRDEPASPARRQEILRLLAELRSELGAIGPSPGDIAERASRLTEAVHEAARAEDGTDERRVASGRLAESIREFETSHPRLAAVAQAVADALASAGM